MYRESIARELIGVQVVIVTPFGDDMSVDLDCLQEQVTFLIDRGIRRGKGVLIAFGSTGECASLTLDERKRGLEAIMEAAAGRVPVMVGANESGTAMVIDLVQHASAVGADAAMILPPYYMSPNLESMERHFQAISAATDLPIMVYNNPDIVGLDVPLPDLARLCEIEHVVGIKECTWSMDKLRVVAANLGDRLLIVNGNGELQEPFGYLSGTVGFVSAIANFAPRLSLAVHEAGIVGDTEHGMELYHASRAWNQLLTEIATRDGAGQAISVVKASMEVLGWPGMAPRLPLYPLAEADRARLRAVLDEMPMVDRFRLGERKVR
jgi:4-hydroxy-tetrahydrodipicolinate synthase